MDRVKLSVLEAGLREDASVIIDAGSTARLRIEQAGQAGAEAAAFQLHRLYNVLEKAFERICRSFENHLDQSGSYHDELIERMTLRIPEIRPEFLPRVAVEGIRRLKGFRHVFRHAYDLVLDPARLAELVAIAEGVAIEFPKWVEAFKQNALAGIAAEGD